MAKDVNHVLRAAFKGRRFVVAHLSLVLGWKIASPISRLQPPFRSQNLWVGVIQGDKSVLCPLSVNRLLEIEPMLKTLNKAKELEKSHLTHVRAANCFWQSVGFDGFL